MSTTPTPDSFPVKCPHCRKTFPLTDAMLGPILEEQKAVHARDLAATRERLEEELRTEMNSKAQQWAAEKSSTLVAQANARAEEATKKAADAQSLLTENERKLAEAQQAQAEAARMKLDLETKQRELELTVARRVQEESASARQQIAAQERESAQLVVAERDDLIRNLQAQIADLNQRVTQGSTQNQGEAQELVLESTLRSTFPIDDIAPVAKGQFGGDCLQRVLGTSGQQLGSILWESKRTKNWEPRWIAKLKADQRAAKAEAAVLATQAMPGDIVGFGLVDGVWVCEFRYAMAVALALRQGLVDVAAVRASREGMATKAELVYEYLTGAQFKQRVAAVAERLRDMRADLESERTAITRLWAKREQQILGAAAGMSMLFGDLQGIAGASVGEVEGMQLPKADGVAATA